MPCEDDCFVLEKCVYILYFIDQLLILCSHTFQIVALFPEVLNEQILPLNISQTSKCSSTNPFDSKAELKSL